MIPETHGQAIQRECGMETPGDTAYQRPHPGIADLMATQRTANPPAMALTAEQQMRLESIKLFGPFTAKDLAHAFRGALKITSFVRDGITPDDTNGKTE